MIHGLGVLGDTAQAAEPLSKMAIEKDFDEFTPLWYAIYKNWNSGSDEWVNYPNSYEAARELNLHQPAVNKCCNRRRETTGGHKFEFGDPTEFVELEGEEFEHNVPPLLPLELGGLRRLFKRELITSSRSSASIATHGHG